MTLLATPTTVQAALARARRRIGAVDARVLLCGVLKRNAAALLAHDDDVLAPEQVLTYETLVNRRARGEPVAYLVGTREFYGRMFDVTPDVLIPRPETELLIECAVLELTGRSGARVLDLGTGSGCIAITLALELAGAHITGVESSKAALAVAQSNARALGVAVDWRVSDWYSAVEGERYELIVANPPYIAGSDPHLAQGDLRFEPRGALTPEGDGLDAVRRIVDGAPRHLVPGGVLLFEHGYDQGAACRALLRQAHYRDIATHRDLAGIERVSGGRYAGAG